MAKGYSVNVRIGATISDFDKKMQKVTKQIDRISKKFKDVGSSLSKNISLPILGAATALTGIALSSARAADDLMDLSQITGISTSELQAMEYAGTLLGTTLDTITSSQMRLTRSVGEAVQGNKEYIQMFESLGISIYDLNGNLKEAPEIFKDMLNALGKIEDPILRDSIAMELMGKSAMQLNPLIKAGADEFNRLKQEAIDTGAVLSQDTLKQLADFNDKVDAMKMRLKATGAEIGLQFIPILERLLDTLEKNLIPALKNFISAFSALSPKMQNTILITTALIAALAPLLIALGFVASGVKVIISLIPVLTGLFAGLSATITGTLVGSILLAISTIIALRTQWDQIVNFFKITKIEILSVFDSIKNGLKVLGGSIVDSFRYSINIVIADINRLINLINKIPMINIKNLDLLQYQYPTIDSMKMNISNSLQNTDKTNQSINVYVGGQKLNNIVDYSLGTKAFS